MWYSYDLYCIIYSFCIRKLASVILLPYSDSSPDTAAGRYLGFTCKVCANINAASHNFIHLLKGSTIIRKKMKVNT